MAIIKCPDCGKDISDRAEACPHCGKILKKENILCEECGQIIPEGRSACPNCGCPVSLKEKDEQKNVLQKTNIAMKPCRTCGKLVEKSAKKCPYCGSKTKRKNGCLISLLVMVILILGTFASCKVMNTIRENEEYITLGSETITLKEFYEEVKDNKVKFATKYKDKKVTIVGRIESIEGGSYNTNLNHHFNSIISIRCDNTTYSTFIYVEAGSTSKASQFEVGDLVKVTGKFSSNLYSDYYMYGPNTITKVSD